MAVFLMSESCSSGRLSSCDLGAVIVQEQPGRSLVRSLLLLLILLLCFVKDSQVSDNDFAQN
uniref:Uncharacterized protein n=1 Tax=Magallana gigas TaxID=29159 RepID=K1QR18_MAGGI